MIDPIPKGYEGRVVELGTGTAPLTLRLVEKCPRARILSCEINPVLAHDARQNLARAGVNGNVQVLTKSAEELLRQLDRTPEEPPGFVISGLPLGNLGRNAVLGVLRASHKALAPGGMFIQAQHFLVDLKNVRSVFPNVRTVPVWRNVPPVFVYYARK